MCGPNLTVVVEPAKRRAESYPVNRLRNLALSFVRNSSHVFLSDVDFWPSVGLRERILHPSMASVLATASQSMSCAGRQQPLNRAAVLGRTAAAYPAHQKPPYSPVSKSRQMSTYAPSLQLAAGSRSGIV